ncbi:DUF2958 domain-containing protein [Salinarimonas rosea]|uniref:DUF2958 domain-containing protein n=1 Tax=Salinarimonas rosea TaxID=552063 RepID=UPI00048F6575|nr:DUF2958 domain-containing protein [Salinarimonas rosea]
MKLLTRPQREALLRNGRERLAAQERGEDEPDVYPVVKLFTPDAACTWLLSELDPENEDIAFGLCDLGFGTPELGSVSLSELEAVRGRLGLPVERDRHFSPAKTLSAYAAEAAGRGCVRA